MTSSVFQLCGTCNNYPWGKKGKESLAAQLCKNTPGSNFEIDDDKNYSEMWFGDYPDFPGRVLETGELLKDALAKNKEKLLGKKVIEQYDAQLPYLPKILSIAKALPLQIHPNKDLATKLHQEHPDDFTDPNHKPEIAVALSKFEVFAGFKPLDQIAPLFQIAALQRFCPDKKSKWTDDKLREVTRTMLEADDAAVKEAEAALAKTPRSELGDAGYILDLLPRLQKQYDSKDAGSLVALLCMNYMVFGPGDAIYIPADGIHAYLSGNIVECMARSNNVLNTGFCPRPDRDNIDLFASALTFRSHSKRDVYLPSKKSPASKTGRTSVYAPPMSEFNMLKTELNANESEELAPFDGPGVFIVTRGSGSMHADGKDFDLAEGYIFFVAPGIAVKWQTKDGMEIHEAVI